MNRKLAFVPGEFYHVYNRGNNKSTIFFDDADRIRFVKLLLLCNSKQPVITKTVQGQTLDSLAAEMRFDKNEQLANVGAYCLMPNHFHLLLSEPSEGSISKFLQKLSTAYSMYVNKRYERTGSLFEGAFKAKHADNDQYLSYLFAYIHLNPIKLFDPGWRENGISDIKKAEHYLNRYRFSSYFDYRGVKRLENVILNKAAFPEYFEGTSDFHMFVKTWLSYPRSDLG